MITCKLLLCSQGVVRDADQGGIYVFNILESVESVDFPFFMQKMDVFALFERLRDEPAQHEVRFQLSIGETELLNSSLAIDFQGKLRNRSTLHILGLVIPNPGVLKVSTRFGDTILGTYEVIVEQITAPRVEARQAPAGTKDDV
ncbi:MAG TPA: hypothetical protein VHE58_02230 [Burkholderiales bacterium]|nr:hypothetical protein [Burkholderiales bacterium]